MIHFYDSASPENIPSGVYAAFYVNGFAWSQEDIDRMHKVFGISVHPEAHWARQARCIDVERGAAAPTDVVPFLEYRQELQHNDGTVYVNRSNWPTVQQLVNDAVHSGRLHRVPFYWVATLDGTTDVSADGNAWAVQYTDENNRFDLSVLKGIDNFHRP